MKVVIVGGVAGGATAAARIRRLDERAEIIVFERSNYVSYANCGLPYYIGEVITEKAELTLQTPESFWKRFRIDIRVRHEVESIDPEKKTVKVRNLETGECFWENYDKLVLSPGAKAIMPKGSEDKANVFRLRTVEDTYGIYDFIKEKKPSSAIIVGGGFIGIELAENLHEMGIKVTMIQRSNHLLPTIDYDMASFLHAKLRKKGIDLVLNSPVDEILEENGKIKVKTGNVFYEADMAVMGLGVTPDSKLAKEAGLELGQKESIVVNDKMETSAADIYAAGDAVEVKHYITGKKALIALAGPANKQGRIVADQICGIDSRFKGSQGSSIIKVFDLTVASTGINEKTAKALGMDYDRVYLSPMSHAGYYPGGTIMTLKVIYEKNTYKLLGAQIVGNDGVDKRIDVLATAMHMGMTALQLKDLDLSYAPPYSSAKDPVNMAGFMIENIANGKVKQYFWDEMKNPEEEDAIFLDTRTPGEVKRGMAAGYRHIPVDELRERLGELEKGKPVYVMCQSGLRSYIACRILEQNGYDCYNFAGGYRLYSSIFSEKEAAVKSMPCGLEVE